MTPGASAEGWRQLRRPSSLTCVIGTGQEEGARALEAHGRRQAVPLQRCALQGLQQAEGRHAAQAQGAGQTADEAHSPCLQAAQAALAIFGYRWLWTPGPCAAECAPRIQLRYAHIAHGHQRCLPWLTPGRRLVLFALWRSTPRRITQRQCAKPAPPRIVRPRRQAQRKPVPFDNAQGESPHALRPSAPEAEAALAVISHWPAA